MTDVPGMSPERPIIWFSRRPVTGSRRRSVDVPIQNFCIFIFPVKNSNRCVKQDLLHLKNFFSLSYQFFCWSLKSSLEVPDVRTFRGRSRDVACRLGYCILIMPFFYIILTSCAKSNTRVEMGVTPNYLAKYDLTFRVPFYLLNKL